MQLPNLKTPLEILNFMDNIRYGYLDTQGKTHVGSLAGIHSQYKVLSIPDTLKYKIGTCIEQVNLMHVFLNQLALENHIFCVKIHTKSNTNTDEEPSVHCFILYYDASGVHQIEHPNGQKRGIYHYKNEEKALKAISHTYLELFKGASYEVFRCDQIPSGLTLSQFYDYLEPLRSNSRRLA